MKIIIGYRPLISFTKRFCHGCLTGCYIRLCWILAKKYFSDKVSFLPLLNFDDSFGFRGIYLSSLIIWGTWWRSRNTSNSDDTELMLLWLNYSHFMKRDHFHNDNKDIAKWKVSLRWFAWLIWNCVFMDWFY